MSRIIENERKEHVVTLECDPCRHPDRIAIVVGDDKNVYLWVGSNICYATFSGPRQLRKLAKAILAALSTEQETDHE